MNAPFMNASQRLRLGYAALLLLLAGCGGGSDVGNQPDTMPLAKVSFIGNAFEGNAAGDAATTVRSGSEVLLSGKDSRKSDNPILDFSFRQTSGPSVDLIRRGTNAVAFAAPDTSVPLELKFELSIKDSHGDTASAQATVNVEPVQDPNQFLTFIGEGHAAHRFTLVAATSTGLAPGASDATFRISVFKRVTYTGRDGLRHQFETLLWRSTNAQGRFVATAGSVARDPFAYNNPRFTLPLPVIDADQINKPLLDVGEADKVLDLPQIAPFDDRVGSEAAKLEVLARMEPGVLDDGTTPDPAGIAAENTYLIALDTHGAVVAQQAGSGSAGAELLLDVDADLMKSAPNAQMENAATARAYYTAIDPTSAKRTLNEWLLRNCFDPQATDFGAELHAVYVNNHDLGFGRDMYVRKSAAGCAAATDFEAGDVASLVINYRSLDAAAKKTNPFVAVAMEYTHPRASDGQRDRTRSRIVTFYTFALDPASGAFKRVLTANFDGRGEKYQPGTCLVCHGGRPQSLVADTYPNSGDVGGTFLPWDLDSLLFTSDAEADFSSAADFAALRTKYSRTAQLDMLKRMNEAALSTYADYPLLDQNAQPLLDASNNPLQVSMQVPRDLLHRWYGYTASSPNYDPQFRGPFATAASYQDRERAAPDDWTAATTTNGISGTTLYHEVFARNCRSCHAQRVTDLSSSTGQSRIPTFARYQEFSDAFVAANGVPLGRDYVFSRGWMPAARLTDDRLWSGRQPSSGSLLASHFDLRDANQSLLRGPGPAPAAQFILQDLTNEDSGQVLAGLTLVGDTIRLDGRSSSFARDSAWQVTGPNGAIDVVGQHAAEAGFKVDAEGEYTITLVANNGSIASPAATESLRVPSQITFETKIYGLLQASCYRCHSPDGANSAMFALAPKFMAPQVAGTDYVATTYATLTGSTQFIDPANPTASPMLTVPSTGTRPSGGLHGPLWANSPQQQIARAWLNQGYPF